MSNNELKIIDLCGRLPYGLMVQVRVFPSSGIEHYTETLDRISFENQIINGWYDIDFIKPYLRPMDSMTDAESEEYDLLRSSINGIYSSELGDWLNAHYFDYRGLIHKGLALEAPDGMY